MMVNTKTMANRAMARKLEANKAIDVADARIHQTGRYKLAGPPVEGMDYCDAKAEQWIWSIGRELATGDWIASATPDLYDNPLFECVWLR